MKRLKPFGPVDGFIHVGLVSMLFYMAVFAKQKPFLSAELLKSLKQWVPLGREFVKKYGISIKAYQAYTQLLMVATEEETIDDHLYELLDSYRAAMPKIQRDVSISHEQLGMIKDIMLWMKNESCNALARVERGLSTVTSESALIAGFQKDLESQDPFLEELIPLVKKLGGSGVPIKWELTIEESRAVNKTKPALYKKYLELKRTVEGIAKRGLMDYVRASGKESVPIKDAVKYLEAQGIQHKLPMEFKGNVGEDGALYTGGAKQLRLSSAPRYKIVMNPKYDPIKDDQFVATEIRPTLNAKGKPNVAHLYTVQYTRRSMREKYKMVSVLIKNQNKYRRKWIEDMKSDDPDRWVFGLMVELSYSTCARISEPGAENTKGRTFGLSSWLVGNIKRMGPSRIIEYTGKDSVHHKHKIDPSTAISRLVIKRLDSLTKDRPRKELVFEVDGKYYSPQKIRTYFKTLTGISDVSIHKIRTMRGTELAEKELEKRIGILDSKRSLTQTVVDKSFQEALTAVGKLLGHVKGVGAEQKATWTTASKSYVDADLQRSFYEHFADRGIRLNKTVARNVGTK